MNALFEAQGVTKKFADHVALHDISMTIPEHTIFGLLGPNGAGKTTLIRIINQITAPDNGSLFFKGQKLQSSDIYRIGYLPEERGLYKKMKVGEQAMYLAQLKGLTKSDARIKLHHWFEKFEILAWWNKKVEELSKGMQQKVQFIVTVVHQPELLIFDEPFSGFDPINVNLLKDEILEFKKKGTTIIFSTHNMASVEELCDHIVLIDNAEKILEGSVKKIKEENKSNRFEVVYAGNKSNLQEILSTSFKVIEETESDGYTTAIIKIKNGKTQNDLLAEMLPHRLISSFTEILPTMNEIFISKVEKNKSKA